jgi:hypothetical protein
LGVIAEGKIAHPCLGKHCWDKQDAIILTGRWQKFDPLANGKKNLQERAGIKVKLS